MIKSSYIETQPFSEDVQAKATMYIKHYNLDFVDVQACSTIFAHCNDKQFKVSSKLDLREFLNLRNPEFPIKLHVGEKLRMCYLIRQLLKHRLPEYPSMKRFWLQNILKACNITKISYDSSPKQPFIHSSTKSRRFIKAINAALEVLEPRQFSPYIDDLTEDKF